MTELTYRRQAAETLVELVRRVAGSLQSGLPSCPIQVEDQLPLFDGRYYYVTVRCGAMNDLGVRPRQVRFAAEIVPEHPRALLAGGIQQERGPGGESRQVQPTSSDDLQKLLYDTLAEFITRHQNVGYIDPGQDKPRTNRTYLNPQEALDAATPHPNGTQRATGTRLRDGRRYEAFRRESGEEFIGPVGGLRHIPTDDIEELLGVDWESEQCGRMQQY